MAAIRKVPYISQTILILLLLILGMIYTSSAFSNDNFRPTQDNSNDVRLRNNNNRQKISNNFLKWTVAKIRDGRNNLQELWNGFMYNAYQPIRKDYQLTASERKSKYYDPIKYWKSLMSKAWLHVTGFLQRSENHLTRRRMDTNRGGGFAALVSAAPGWFMPLAIPLVITGMGTLLREPLNIISNTLSGNFKSCFHILFSY